MKIKIELKKDNSLKDVTYECGMFAWFPCPYCKKTVILIPPKEKKNRKALRKWQKQKPLIK